MLFLELSKLELNLKWAVAEIIEQYLTDPGGRTQTSNTGTFNGDGGTATFSLSNSSNFLYISSVVSDSVTRTKWQDYSINYGTDATTGTKSASITFKSHAIPAVGTGNVVVTYYTGTRYVYIDYPNKNLSEDGYPRITIFGGTNTQENLGRDHANNKSYWMLTTPLQLSLWTPNKVVYSYKGEKMSNNLLLDAWGEEIIDLFKNQAFNNLYPKFFDFHISSQESELQLGSVIWQKVMNIERGKTVIY